MHLPQIRCYHPEGLQLPHVFYVLSKGPNAGRPSYKPWTNSFQVVCTNPHWFDFYFWLVFGLFKAGKFKIHHRGSVIPFINRSDLYDVIKKAATEIYPHWQRYQQILETVDQLEKKKTSLAEQIVATEKLQSYLIRSCFFDV